MKNKSSPPQADGVLICNSFLIRSKLRGIKPKEIKKKIAELIRQNRAAKQWTQEKLSGEAGINNPYLQKLESGSRMPSLIVLFKLTKALEDTPDGIITSIWQEWLRQS